MYNVHVVYMYNVPIYLSINIIMTIMRGLDEHNIYVLELFNNQIIIKNIDNNNK